MPIVALSDFEGRHGSLEQTEQVKVAELLADAEALILDVASGSEATWVTTELDAPRAVVQAAVQATYRAWSNPDAFSQMSMGDVAASYTREGVADAMFLTDREIKTVLKASERSKFRAVTLVTPYSGAETTDLLGS